MCFSLLICALLRFSNVEDGEHNHAYHIERGPREKAVSLSLLSCSKLVLFFFVVLFYFYANFFFLDNLIQASSSRVLEFGIDQNDRARARTIYFPTRAGLAQDFSARVELELYC
jgi:hypothetical protein